MWVLGCVIFSIPEDKESNDINNSYNDCGIATLSLDSRSCLSLLP